MRARARPTDRHRRSVVTIVTLTLALAGCGGAGGSTDPGVPGADDASAGPAVTSSAAPRPSGTLSWPSEFGVDLVPGTYFSSPPFDVPFTLTVAETGWQTGHLHSELFDLIRFDGLPETDLPAVLFGFSVPTMVRGAGGNKPAAGMTPDAAIDGLATRADITATNRAGVDLFGRSGARVDLHADVDNTALFGGPAGNFGLGPERNVRIAAVAFGGGLLLVLVMAPPGEVEEAWDRVQPILASIALPGA
ncbi:MAG: hypothetical protein HYX55_01730 [Chloroflexi bacterium]|nr:hypothetical protein [Chloroflexota bacterium]